MKTLATLSTKVCIVYPYLPKIAIAANRPELIMIIICTNIRVFPARRYSLLFATSNDGSPNVSFPHQTFYRDFYNQQSFAGIQPAGTEQPGRRSAGNGQPRRKA